jgi:tripartite-type tricarboxylate transporter receptor subunit TctC
MAFFVRWLCLSAVFAFCASALAQGSFPTKPVHIIVGFAAGGNPDVVARLLAQKLSEHWGQQVIVENRPGSNGNIAAEVVAKSPADGYTMLSSDTTTFAINPHVYSKIPFDPFRDFTPLAQTAVPPMYVVVHPSLPVTSMQELVAYAKAHPGKISYASAGNGSIHHLATELFKAATGIDMVHIPFKGSGQSAPALIAGDVQLGFVGFASVSQAIKAGRLRVIGFASGTRSVLNPDVPTIAETVAPGFDVTSPMGFAGPANIPREVVERIQSAVVAAARAPDVREKIIAIGLEPAEGNAEVYAESIRRDYEKFGRVVKQIGLKID